MYGVKFRDVFNPTPEQKAERDRKLRETHERLVAEHDCCVCRHYQCIYTGLGYYDEICLRGLRLYDEICLRGHVVVTEGINACRDWRLPPNERYPGEVFPGEERS